MMEDRFAAPATMTAPSSATFGSRSAPFPGTEGLDPTMVVRGPGYTAPPSPTNPLAQVALWVSVPSLLVPPLLIVTAVLGVIAWILASRRQNVGGQAARGATAISATGILLWVSLYVLFTGLILS